MATSRPFAYNPSRVPISGTEQLGDLAIAVDQQYYSQGLGGVRWWNGPDEDPGYIICFPFSAGTRPSPDGNVSYLGFKRSENKTDQAFINMSNAFANGAAFFTGATEAKTWLNTNGYWTSYGSTLVVYLDSGNPSSYSGSGSNWSDLSGLGNNATLINSPTYSSSYDGILQFDDASLEYSTIPNLGNLTEWTVESWFRLTSPLTGKVTSIVSNEFDLVNKLNFSIGTNNAPSNTNLAVGFFDGTWHSTTGFVPQVGIWYQVVGTYDGSVIRQYVNGVPSGGTVNYVGTPQSGGEVRLMRRWDSPLVQSNLVDGDLAIVKIYNTAQSDSEILSNYNSTFSRFIDPTPTPTPTNTPTPTTTVTPTSTPTNTPTPSTTPQPVTGYSFNLVALPYNFPSSGNSIMNGPAGVASTDPNALATGARGFYFNSIDSDSVDRTNYFSAFTGQSVTITLSQTGSTAIYSGDTNSFKQWIASPMGSGFVFGAGIGVPPTNTPSGTAVLIQSATTQFTIGLPVYVSLIQN